MDLINKIIKKYEKETKKSLSDKSKKIITQILLNSKIKLKKTED